MKKYPKVLIFTVAAWNSVVGSNTWPTLLEGYPSEELANLCIREEYPDSDVCSRYFVISENRVIKSLRNRNIKTGYEVDKTKGQASQIQQTDKREHDARYEKMAGRRRYSLLIAREAVWKLGAWRSDALDAFLDDFKPDLILHSMEGYIHLNRIIEYAIKRTGATAVGYIWDDNFTYLQSDNWGHRILRFFQRKSLKSLAAQTRAFFAISPKTKKEADAFFGIQSVVLTKPLISMPTIEQYKIDYPIRMLYTGKLIYGREETVAKVAQLLQMVNSGDTPKLLLDIYTNTRLPDPVKEQICNRWCVIHPPVPQNEVQQLQRQADVLLFAEAMDGPMSQLARLSFSTKITDYLSVGKCIFAVGKLDSAPMEYFAQYNIALTADNSASIQNQLQRMVETPTLIQETAENCSKVAVQMHAPDKIRKIFWSVLQDALETEPWREQR